MSLAKLVPLSVSYVSVFQNHGIAGRGTRINTSLLCRVAFSVHGEMLTLMLLMADLANTK